MKTKATPAPLPEVAPAPAVLGPQWLVTTAIVPEVIAPNGASYNIPDGLCIRVTAAEAVRLQADGAARPASEEDLKIGAGMARDLSGPPPVVPEPADTAES
ncbi:hypothetical protein sos41_11870 [Alphaproteobacteria bacterium SO-S41]|nr:hypothetical protein sos41_11870 [Alphaproteobacteria bacterium SO-S41]